MTFAITANCFGASAIAFGSKTTKKFGSKRAKFTLRVLAITVFTVAPCTFHVSTSPTFTNRSAAMLSSMLTRLMPSGAAGAVSNHLPAISVSLFTSVSR